MWVELRTSRAFKLLRCETPVHLWLASLISLCWWPDLKREVKVIHHSCLLITEKLLAIHAPMGGCYCMHDVATVPATTIMCGLCAPVLVVSGAQIFRWCLDHRARSSSSSTLLFVSMIGLYSSLWTFLIWKYALSVGVDTVCLDTCYLSKSSADCVIYSFIVEHELEK